MTPLLRLIVMEDPEFNDYKLLAEKLDKLTLLCGEVILLSPSWQLPGTTLAEYWALRRWHCVQQWATYHDKKNTKGNYTVRNKKMVRNADAVCVFWDLCNLEIKDLLMRAKKRNLTIRQFMV